MVYKETRCQKCILNWPFRRRGIYGTTLGFVDPTWPHHVCHLKKVIYGHKQAPLAWFQHFSGFLLQLQFGQSLPNISMFVLHTSMGTIVLLLYVDDIIIVGDSHSSLLVDSTSWWEICYKRPWRSQLFSWNCSSTYYFFTSFNSNEVHSHLTLLHWYAWQQTLLYIYCYWF